VEIYIAAFAGLLSTVLLAVVYLGDRYEREPIDLIQNYFLSGVLGQLALILVFDRLGLGAPWTGPWIVLTAGCVGLYLPFQLRRESELDEVFDGVVYSVALVAGAVCVMHLRNLPIVIAESPYRAALATGAEPDLRDLMILAASPGFSAEFGRGIVLVAAAVLGGAVLGTLQLRGWRPLQTAPVVVACVAAVVVTDLATGGAWPLRGGLAVAAVACALWVKRWSAFRNRPEPMDRDVILDGVKTILIVFGASILTTVALQSLIEQPGFPEESGTRSQAFEAVGE
jgi:hypothetical protein